MDSGSAVMAHLPWLQFHAGNAQMFSSAMAMHAGAQSMAGSLMSQGMAAGAPMLGGLGVLMGLDPLSMGIRAGGLAWTRGGMGVLGAGMVGMGAMAGVGLVGAGAAMMGGQVLSGAQQQMALNNGLSRNLNFLNARGGQGFTVDQGFGFGQDLRAMTHEYGAAGEVTTFSELSRLAVSMSRMGMSQNVRTVKEFKEKFKQMLDSVKTIATELGTSLEEAQKMMASMRQVGIYKPGQAAATAKFMRQTALGGGLAMSEVSSMANIGMQVSRSVGGLGAAGAIGGMKTIGQIGTAIQMGVLSQEDIFNATGLDGAEGRQAFATEMMSRSAQFLKSNRGRWFLASLAGKDGQLDQSSLMEWMSGGSVDVNRTRQLAKENLHGVGRANFIRNEGRLRGDALGALGGFMLPMAYKQWLAGKGWDPTAMDDRAKLAFQRFSGLGRDMADEALKTVAQLPSLLREQAHIQDMAKWSDAEKLRMSTTGVTGAKRKLDQVREGLQGTLQQIGADILRSGTEMIDSWVSQVTGIYERQYTREMERSFRAGLSGTASGKKMFFEQFGTLRGMEGMRGQGLPGAAEASPSSFYGSGGLLGELFTSPAERYAKAGYKFKEGMNLDEIKARQLDIDQISQRAVAKPTQRQLELGKKYSETLRNMLSGGALGSTRGEDRLNAYKAALRQRAEAGDKAADVMLWEVETTWGGPGAQMAALSGMEEGAGITGFSSDLWSANVPDLGFGGARMTAAERAKALGEYTTPDEEGKLGGRTWTSSGWSWAAMGATMGSAAALGLPLAVGATAFAGVGSLLTGENLFAKGAGALDDQLESWFGDKARPSAAVKRAKGEQWKVEENKQLIARLHSRSEEDRKKGFEDVTNRLMKLGFEKAQRHLSVNEQGEELFLRDAKASQVYMNLRQRYGDNIPKEVLQDAIQSNNLTTTDGRLMTTDQFEKSSVAFMLAWQGDRDEGFLTSVQAYGKKGAENAARYKRSGLATYEDGRLTLSADALKSFGVGKDGALSTGANYAMGLIERLNVQQQMANTTDVTQASKLYDQLQDQEDNLSNLSASLTVAQKKALAGKLLAAGMADEANELMYKAGLQDRLQKGRGGTLKIASDILGLDLGEEERKQLAIAAKKGGQDLDMITEGLAGKTGLSADALKELVTATSSGKPMDSGKLAELIASLQGQMKPKEEIKSPVVTALEALPGAIAKHLAPLINQQSGGDAEGGNTSNMSGG